MCIQKNPKDTKVEIAKCRYSFRLSYDDQPRKTQQSLRKELFELFEWKTNRSFYTRLNGDTELTAREKEVMDVVFNKYGIKWDYEYESADQKGE